MHYSWGIVQVGRTRGYPSGTHRLLLTVAPQDQPYIASIWETEIAGDTDESLNSEENATISEIKSF